MDKLLQLSTANTFQLSLYFQNMTCCVTDDPLDIPPGDKLDHSLSSLALTAALSNQDLWSYVQRLPHLFSTQGLFYQQVDRDMGLRHGKHCTLPLLPGKVSLGMHKCILLLSLFLCIRNLWRQSSQLHDL